LLLVGDTNDDDSLGLIRNPLFLSEYPLETMQWKGETDRGISQLDFVAYGSIHYTLF
jgi:hypothetical protein